MIEKFKRFFQAQKREKADWYLIGAIWLLVIIGIIIISSAGVALGWQKYSDAYYHLKHQLLVGILPGALFFIFFWFFDYKKLEKLAAPMLYFSIALLVIVLIPGIGTELNGARAWINIFGITTLQPSEIVKLTFLIYLAAWLAQKEEHHFRNASDGLTPFIIALTIITGLIVLEKDTGTMMIIVAMSLTVYFAAGGRLLHLAWLGIGGLAGLIALIKISPYRAARFSTFLHPEFDPKGLGYHINQALLAIGTGGWLGLGYGHSRQKFAYLPEPVGDSIFAVTAEELGFFLSTAIIALYVFVAVRGLKLAARCRDPFAKLLTVGIITWLTVQAFVNIGGIIGIMPMTGVTLPFISFGGSSMIASLAAAGILANISKQNA